MLAIIPFAAAASVAFQRGSSRAYADARAKVSEVNADLQENIAGLRVSQAYRREERNAERFAGRSDAYRRSRLRAQRYISLYFPFIQSLSTLAAALVLLVAAGQMRSGALTAGALIAYLLYIDMLFSPVQQLSQVFDGYQQAVVGVHRISELLRTPTSTPQAARPRAGWPRPGPDRAAGCPFQLPAAAARRRWRELTCQVAPGETVALVGRDRGGQVHPGQAGGPVLRRDRRAASWWTAPTSETTTWPPTATGWA